MRVSDWSSDGCSSDLTRRNDRRPAPAYRAPTARTPRSDRRGATAGVADASPASPTDPRVYPVRCENRRAQPRRPLDRQRGEQGQSVTVRVALGVRRLNKKNSEDEPTWELED